MRPSRPRIALNAQLLQLDAGYRSAGIARYILNLLRALPEAAPDLELHAFTSEREALRLLNRLEIHLSRVPRGMPMSRLLWEQFVFPFQLKVRHFDAVHSLAFVSPVLSRQSSIVTVFDLSFLVYPDYFRTANRIYLKWGTRWSAARAKRVIAISENTKRDLVRLFRVPEDKIAVIPPGVEAEFFANGDGNALERFRASKRLPDHFVLFVGTLEPRKNIPQLIRAFMHVKERNQLPHVLMIVGGKGWKEDEIGRTIEELSANQAVEIVGFVPQAELPYWYRSADAFVYPSQYEGFGIPLLEAMASGAPVISSNASSLPEVTGDAAILVNPEEQAQLEAALARVLTDGELREVLSARGWARARQFSWERAARATCSVYRTVLESTAST